MDGVFWLLFTYGAIERVAELSYSRRNQIRMNQQGFTKGETRIGMLAMASLHAAWFLAMVIEVHYFPTSLSTSIRACSACLFIAAQGLRFWTLGTLGRFWNISIMTRSTISGSFVSNGPYRFVRHPNYLAVIVEFATLPMIGGAYRSALIFSLANAFILRRRISLEERQLFKIPGYRERMGTTPRLIPRLTNRDGHHLQQ
jgi:methyltransferase